VKEKYIPIGVIVEAYLSLDFFPVANSAKDIHWTSSCLQPLMDFVGKGRRFLLHLRRFIGRPSALRSQYSVVLQCLTLLVGSSDP